LCGLRSNAWPILLGLVLLLCGFLRAHRVAFQPWEDDELSSAQAALAIADTGLPRYAEDIYYTRSPLYHYLVGASVRLMGHNIWGLRLPSVLFATATAFLIYLAGDRLLKSRWTGLVAAALYAIHPYAIFVGHLVRFYQQQQFFCLLTIYFFCEGFVTVQNKRARSLAVGSLLAACLSQELSMALAAPLFVGYLLFARSTPRRSTLSLAVAVGCVVALVAVDLGVFLTACQTRLDGISPNVEATLAPHFANPLNFCTMFLSYSRLHLTLSVFLFLSLPLVLAGKNRNALALLVMLFGGVVATNLLVTLEALRYLYWLLPVWLLLGVYGIRALVRALTVSGDGDSIARQWLVLGLGTLLVVAVVASWSPWKTFGSYDTAIVSDSTSALSYVRRELREGDAVAATEPQPPAGILEVGRMDYDVSVPLLDDFVYRKNGRLVDRNTGAQVISTLEQLEDAITRHDRLWMVVDRMRFRSRGQDILWGYPAARIEAFLRENFELKHESFQYAVFLWDAHSGKYHSFREHGTPAL
jgi:4-amino-4-deoxy-L-arabinose transferase-like glycosyltransferase